MWQGFELCCTPVNQFIFCSVTLSARSPQIVIKSEEDQEFGVLFLGWRAKIPCVSSWGRVHAVAYQKVWRDWRILCGGLMTAESFTEGQYGKLWSRRGELIKHQYSSPVLPLATVSAASVTDNFIVPLMTSFPRIGMSFWSWMAMYNIL